MRSWSIFFSRGIPKRNFDIRRFDSHHQFHSFFHLDDQHSFYRQNATSFLLTQQRFQTTKFDGDRDPKVSTVKKDLGIDEQLERLGGNVKRREFERFEKNFGDFSRSRAMLNHNQSQRLISTLKEWHNAAPNLPEKDYARTIKKISDVKFSGTNKEHQDLIIALTDKFFEKKEHSFRWFALFLTGLKGLKHSGHFLNEKQRQRTMELFGELRKDCDERAYSELLSGIVGLRIYWDEISEAGKQNLLNHLEVLKSDFTADRFYTVVFNFGKLGVNLKNLPCKHTITKLTEKALLEMQGDNGEGMLNLSRVVS
jgi:hypothetical protein